MDRDEIIKRIDILTRGLSQRSSHISESSEIKIVRNEVEEEDKPKLAALLEDLIVLLKDDPENKGNMEQTNGWLWAYQANIRIVGISETFFSR
jgi:hypothetical protein